MISNFEVNADRRTISWAEAELKVTFNFEQETFAYQFRQLNLRHDASGSPGLVSYYLDPAYGHIHWSNYPAATAAAEQALRLASNNPVVNSRLGFWYLQRDTARTNRYRTRTGQFDPQASVSWLNRGWLRYGQQRYAAAVVDYSAAISVNPRYINAYAD